MLETLDAFASPISKRGCISIRSEIAPALLASEGFVRIAARYVVAPDINLQSERDMGHFWSSIDLKHLSSLVQSRYG
jgi:hypothetical protein